MVSLSRGAWLLCGVTLSLLCASVWLGAVNGATAGDLSTLLFVAACALVGGLVSSRRPRLIVGWLFGVSALSFTLMQFTAEYALYGLVTNPGSLPATRALEWPQSWLPVPGIMPVAIFLPLVFPDGRAPSDRWRTVIRVFAVLCVVMAGIYSVRPENLYELGHGPAMPNPLGFDALRPYMGVAGDFLPLMIVAGIVLGAICTVQRYRSAGTDERLQIKWLMLAIIVLPIVAVGAKLYSPVQILTLPALVAVPVSVAIAVLRYRLYDIDLIIRRTLIYGALTATLGTIYILLIVALDALAGAVLGQPSDLTIAVATLAAAALFTPLRHRIQSLIDRAFYRRKYDAARVLTDFQARLRDDVDLDLLGENVVTVVHETVQPAFISLWLPPSESDPLDVRVAGS